MGAFPQVCLLDDIAHVSLPAIVATCSNKMVDFNPWLLAATCCYLASKAEESSLRTTDVLKMLRSKTFFTGARAARGVVAVGGCSRALAHTPLCLPAEHGGVARFTDTLLLQCEFVLLENLQFDLVVFHPYRPLQLYLRDIGLEAECMQTAWFVGWLGLGACRGAVC